MLYNKQMYRPGDFVYVEPKERGMDWSILNIDRLWTEEDGKQMLHGNFFYRPNETYHVATRKFLEKVPYEFQMLKFNLQFFSCNISNAMNAPCIN